MVRHQPHPKALHQCRAESELGLDQQWVKKDATLCQFCNAHNNIVDNLSLIEVAEQFANAKQRCWNEFDPFTEKNLH